MLWHDFLTQAAKHNHMKIKSLVLISFISAVAFYSCKKDSESSTTLNVRMTDGPAAVEEVNIDLRSVEVKLANDSSHWLTLNSNAGIYNLLGLQNGIDTLIGTGT